MKVLKLEVFNYLGVKAVEITPDGNVIRIEGKNEAGKSSVIGAIWAAIGGKDGQPNNPIRKGEKDGRIFIDLGDITVTRTFTEKGTYLTVANKDGFKATSPQETLNKLFTSVSFDPKAFMDKHPKERAEYLLDLTGQREKIDALDKKRKEVYDARYDVNRDVKNLEGKLSDAPEDEDVTEKSVADLVSQLERERERDEEIENMREQIDECNQTIADTAQRRRDIEIEIKELKQEYDQCGVTQDEAAQKAEHLQKMIDKAPASRVSEIQAEINTVDDHNKHVRAVLNARELRKELEQTKAKSDNYTAQIKKIDEEKLALLESAKLPVAGLNVEGDNILIDGIPFDDLATSKRIKISMEICAATQPTLRAMRISQGSELDSDSMAEIYKFAETNDFQVWMECVADEPSNTGEIFIEDGAIKTPEPELVEG